jgi:Na+/H+-dicarboxylate symporter
MKKKVRSRVGSESISQRYGSGEMSRIPNTAFCFMLACLYQYQAYLPLFAKILFQINPQCFFIYSSVVSC